ncbi:hypothetical protein [Psychrobium sp. 1_MG-2023]|uniref:hypothetical protein n=1 Tax=Psychrobium sp. 1_MG-2023 TaxID=3062624 RepID=UPI000C33858D|nr:hypothetical protein [Psychrobium sp. 1_MG-2023]MDP2561824.1 hypothetical protein [Psychrobium sp. 1_MG-2023]PKF55803.1 hypothetical protein CW748_11725 [Alteromonadales bacterium alter-6D02]
MNRPKTHYLFVLLVAVFIVLMVMNILPFPLLVVMLLVSWCALALIIMLIQRIATGRNYRSKQ